MNKELEEIKFQRLLLQVQGVFEKSFINRNNELILIPKTNLYFSLNDAEKVEDIYFKLLAWCSRNASKSMPYHHEKTNRKYWTMVREKINLIMQTNFTHEDMCLIYSRLGNACNEDLTRDFIRSGYDMELLK